MIGIVLVTHGGLALEFVAAMEHVVGAQERVAAICIHEDDDIEARRRDIEEAVAEVDGGDGVILLTDMFGGTPSNLAMSMLEQKGVEVVCGVNLPLLIKLTSIRADRSLAEAVIEARDAGRKYIAVASELLRVG